MIATRTIINIILMTWATLARLIFGAVVVPVMASLLLGSNAMAYRPTITTQCADCGLGTGGTVMANRHQRARGRP